MIKFRNDLVKQYFDLILCNDYDLNTWIKLFNDSTNDYIFNIIIIYNNKDIIGGCRTDYYIKRKCCILDYFVVSPLYRGKKLGRYMIDHILLNDIPFDYLLIECKDHTIPEQNTDENNFRYNYYLNNGVIFIPRHYDLFSGKYKLGYIKKNKEVNSNLSNIGEFLFDYAKEFSFDTNTKAFQEMIEYLNG